MSVRELVFSLTNNDPELNALGLNFNTVYANGAPDSPKERFWAVIHWGPETSGAPGQRGRGRVTERECALWVYNKDWEYAPINAALKRWCALMDAIEAMRTGDETNDGWITQCDWNGDSDDSYDDVYEAYFRSSTYTIVASGD